MEFSQPGFSQAAGDQQKKSNVDYFVSKLTSYGSKNKDDLAETELCKLQTSLEAMNDSRWGKIEEFLIEQSLLGNVKIFLDFASSWLKIIGYVCDGAVAEHGDRRIWKLSLYLVSESMTSTEELASALKKDGNIDGIYKKFLRVVEDEKTFFQFCEVSRLEERNSRCLIESYVDEIIEKIGPETDIETKGTFSVQLALFSTMVSLPKVSQVWRVLLTVWCEKDDLFQPDENDDPAVTKDLLNCLADPGLIRTIEMSSNVMTTTCPASAKLFQRIVKDEKWLVLSSDFGIGLWLVLSSSQRHQNTFAPELKKSIKRLWQMGEEMKETAWLSASSIGALQKIVRKKMGNLLESIEKSEQSRKLFSRPLNSLLQSVVEQVGIGTTISIVDGRVANAPAVWLMARDALTRVYKAQKEVSSEFMQLVWCISSTPSTNVAILFIDVLLEVVKVFSVEVSNLIEQLAGFLEHVCLVKKEVGVLLVRALLPIITHRDRLKMALFNGLRKDLLSDQTVEPAVQMLLLLLRSITKRRNPAKATSATIGTLNFTASQSFATFSTQSLRDIGLPKTVDQTLSMQLVGIIERCLAQPYRTKLAMYEGIAEFVKLNENVTNQFLDMLLNHSVKVSDWTKQNLIEATKSETTLKEPLQHLILTIDMLTFQAQNNDDNMMEITARNMLARSLAMMEKWIDDATLKDNSDLGLDKTTEWSPSTMEGRSNMLFGHLMLSVYDVLIKHLWSRLELLYKTGDADRLIGMLKRRMELAVVLSDKLVRRKEQKASTDGAESSEPTVDFSQAEVRIPATTLMSILKILLPSDITTVSPEGAKLRQELQTTTQKELVHWAIDRLHELTAELQKDYNPMHSVLASTKALGIASRMLFNFYTENEIVDWAKTTDSGNYVKTKAIETYANIIVILCRKLKNEPLKIAMLWYKKPEDEAEHQKRFQVNAQMVIHAHSMACKLIRIAVNDENHELENERRVGAHYEKQVRAMVKVATTVMRLCDDPPRCYAKLFTRMVAMLKEQTFCNNQMLRDYLKLLLTSALNTGEFTGTVVPFMGQVMDDVLQALSEEDVEDDSVHAFVTPTSFTVAVDLVINFCEKTMATVREASVFVEEYCSRTDLLDESLSTQLRRMNELCGLVAQVMTLYVQHQQQEEKVIQLLTDFFTTFDLVVKTILDVHKRFGTTILKDFKALDILAQIVEQSLSSTLAITDNKVGLKKAPEKKNKQNVNTKRKKLRREETIFVAYTKQRETLQSRILTLSKTLKDDRFDLLIKNNSVGHRDFRITFEMVKERMAKGAEEDLGEPPKKKRAKKQKKATVGDETEAEAEAEKETEVASDVASSPSTSAAPVEPEIHVKDEPEDVEEAE